MDVAAIMALVMKGLTVVEALVAAEQNAEPAIKALINLVTGAQKGTVSDDDLNKTEVQLDALIEEFDLDLE